MFEVRAAAGTLMGSPFRKSFRATAKNNRAIYLNSGIKVREQPRGREKRRGKRNDERAVSIATFAEEE